MIIKEPIIAEVSVELVVNSLNFPLAVDNSDRPCTSRLKILAAMGLGSLNGRN